MQAIPENCVPEPVLPHTTVLPQTTVLPHTTVAAFESVTASVAPAVHVV
jgi:hypothetical protein